MVRTACVAFVCVVSTPPHGDVVSATAPPVNMYLNTTQSFNGSNLIQHENITASQGYNNENVDLHIIVNVSGADTVEVEVLYMSVSNTWHCLWQPKATLQGGGVLETTVKQLLGDNATAGDAIEIFINANSTTQYEVTIQKNACKSLTINSPPYPLLMNVLCWFQAMHLPLSRRH